MLVENACTRNMSPSGTKQASTATADSELPFFVTGTVVKGFGRGSKDLGCPTANIASHVVEGITLSTGIYYGFAKLYDTIYMMSCSLGFNPQYENTKKSLEVHLLPDTLEDFYGAELAIVIVAKLREEKKFPSLEALKLAIQNDNELAVSELSSRPFDEIKTQLSSLI